MTNPTYFTVVADYRAVVIDLETDIDPDPQVVPLSAVVTFRPVLRDGDAILATDASPRPIGFVPAPITAKINTAGRLVLRDVPDGTRVTAANLAAFPVTGDASCYYIATDTGLYYRWNGSGYVEILPYQPVRLLADTELLELGSPLYYSVTFSQVIYNGKVGKLNGFTFQAPNSDVPGGLNLIEVMRQPGQPAGGITRIAPGGVRIQDGNIIFTFDGIDLADPIPISTVGVSDDIYSERIVDSTAVGRAVLTGTADEARAAINVPDTVIDATKPPYNIKADRIVIRANMSASSNPTQVTGISFPAAGTTRPAYQFTSSDIGKPIKVIGAGSGGANLKTTIVDVNSGKAVLAEPCLTTVENALVMFGTDNAEALQVLFDAVNVISSRDVVLKISLPRGPIMYSGTLIFPKYAHVIGATEVAVAGGGDVTWSLGGGASYLGGTTLYQMWDQNVDMARVKPNSDTGTYKYWQGGLTGFLLMQDVENTSGNGLVFKTQSGDSVIPMDGALIERIAVSGVAQSGVVFPVGTIPGCVRDLNVYACGWADRKPFTADTTSGSATLTNVSDFTGLVVGGILLGPKIDGDSVIKTLNPGGNSIVMSMPATATATTVGLEQAGSPGVYYKMWGGESVHFDFLAGDQNSGGLLRIVGPTVLGGAVTISNMKSEYGVNVYRGSFSGDWETYPTIPQQRNAIVLSDCGGVRIHVNGIVHWADANSSVGATPPNAKGGNVGSAILVLPTQTGGTGDPQVAWSALNIRLAGGSGQTIGSAFRDTRSGAKIPSVTSETGFGTSFGPLLRNPRFDDGLYDKNGSPILNLAAGSTAGVDGNYLQLSNETSSGAPGFYVLGAGTDISLNFSAKGTGRYNLFGSDTASPTIAAVGSGANYDINLVPKGTTGVVKAGGSPVLIAPTPATKTANYSAAVADLVMADATSTAFTVTLPTGVTDKSRIIVKKIDSSANVVTVATSGSDKFNSTGGATSLTLVLQNQAITAQYNASAGIWIVINTDIPLSQTDVRYQATTTTATALPVGSLELGHATDTTISRVSAGQIAVEGSTVLLNGGALGTPASGTLTNCIIPVAGITASTSTALGVGSIELGHATDTTISRSSAGIVSVEGVNVLTTTDWGTDLLTTGEATFLRRMVTANNVAVSTSTLRLTFFTARKTETITQIRTITGSTAAVGATLCRVGIYSVDGSGNLTLIAATANDTALWIAGTTAYTKSLSASFTKTRGQRYAVGYLVVGASTAPTFVGLNNIFPASEVAASPRLSGFVGSQSDLGAISSTIAVGSISDSAAHQAYTVLLP